MKQNNKPFCLTGNIGCGKTAVAQFLSEYPDVVIIDCDSLAKNIIASGKYKDQINAILGIEAFPEGKVDFSRIASVFFTDAEKKKSYEALIHPLLWEKVDAIILGLDDSMLCIIESAIVYETKTQEMYRAIIAVTCSYEEQIRRLQENRNMTLADIEARLANQLPASEKETKADFLINTECTMSELEVKVDELYWNLKELKEHLISPKNN
jgi:dephospho-CoA kinase